MEWAVLLARPFRLTESAESLSKLRTTVSASDLKRNLSRGFEENVSKLVKNAKLCKTSQIILRSIYSNLACFIAKLNHEEASESYRSESKPD